MVFDEVDAGIGGVTAHEVGRLLSHLAVTTQVIVVTHLPQVAAFAQHHICVQRLSEGVSVSELITDESRIRELARMLGAVEGMDGAEELARQMMGMARSAQSVS
jgi:DNA repair protein RecN (Recombination protein N)